MPKRKVQNMGLHGLSTVSPCLCREYEPLHIAVGFVVLLFLKEAGDSRGALVSFLPSFLISFPFSFIFFLFLFLTLGLNKALESQGARGLGKQASVLPGCMQEKSKVGRTDERNRGKTLRIKAGTL